MQKLYELVVLLHPQLSKDEQSAIYAKIDTILADGKKDTDSMGLMQLAHSIGRGKLTQVQMTSYYCEISEQVMTTMKQELSITKGVVRFVFFSMAKHEPFLTYKGVNEKFEKLLEEKAAADAKAASEAAESGAMMTKTSPKKKEHVVKKGYFNKDAHRQEVSWKAVRLLTFYRTRFGEIKPRRFMGNTVVQQKKLRQAMLRARELGMVAYTN